MEELEFDAESYNKLKNLDKKSINSLQKELFKDCFDMLLDQEESLIKKYGNKYTLKFLHYDSLNLKPSFMRKKIDMRRCETRQNYFKNLSSLEIVLEAREVTKKIFPNKNVIICRNKLYNKLNQKWYYKPGFILTLSE